ncbi:hypothetical protein F511_04416 [Dorcoceras hygrometricum]|uniref:SWIM-type domain-containing protein n=1 Tax=Dorcoceras hygrometricum TaxID=472368 RepID=A0A2Z7D587_9LAMI|nr:hypothetical protein F511_04416 [Dorcoceras hygrometricum]
MRFALIDEAFSFYNQYARQAGFSARLNNSKKNKITNEVVWKQFVCFKEGYTDEIRSSKKLIHDQPIRERARGGVRTGCKSKLTIGKEQTGSNWIISIFIENHNHQLSTPSKVHLLRSHRSVSAAKKTLTQQFAEANVPTYQQMRLLEIEYGGAEHVGCTERDIRNFEKEQRDEQKGFDAETLIEFFESEKEKNSDFFFSYETDSEGRFCRCFWADHDGCMVYDIISFQSSSISKPRVLSHNQKMDYISCSCMKFEFEGIPCRHMLAFFRINQVFKLPEKYILKRWTRDAKVGGHLLGQKNVDDNPEKCLMSRHSKLSYKAAMVIDNASLTDEGTDHADDLPPKLTLI